MDIVQDEDAQDKDQFSTSFESPPRRRRIKQRARPRPQYAEAYSDYLAADSDAADTPQPDTTRFKRKEHSAPVKAGALHNRGSSKPLYPCNER
jgi:hypothetical protein